jgi:phosphoadenosine phosphosulfate reductase
MALSGIILQELEEIRNAVFSYKEKNLSLFATSSFQTHSLPMIHILSRIDNTIPVYFINTGFHFPESISFREEISRLFNIKIIDQNSFVPKHQQKDASGNYFRPRLLLLFK